jgi:hypothetical protein
MTPPSAIIFSRYESRTAPLNNNVNLTYITEVPAGSQEMTAVFDFIIERIV